MINKKNLAEIVGWYGMTAILAAYILVSSKTIPANGYAYQLLNLTGAIGILTISLAKKVKQSVALNVIWAFVALAAIVSLAFQN